jgi:hypothetical protein
VVASRVVVDYSAVNSRDERKMSADSSLSVLKINGQRVCGATVHNGEVSFEDPAIRWHRADHARKLYVLVAEA